MRKKAALINFVLISLVGIILLTQVSVAAFKNVSVGATAPNVILKDLDGNEVSLEKVYAKNEVVLLVFWATWSPRSIRELKELQELSDKYNEKNIEIIAVNVENEDISDEDIAKIKNVVEENGVKYKVVLDNGLSTFTNYGVVAIPSTAIINSNGELIKDYASYATFAFADITDNVEYALGIKEPPEELTLTEKVKKYKPIKKALLRYGMGKKLIARGMADKSIREFKNAIEIDPKFDMPYVLLGDVYYSKAKSQKSKSKKANYLKLANETYLKAINMNPDNLPALSGIALVLIDEKNTAEAEEHLNKALEIEPNFTPAISAMGILLKNTNEKDKAIESFNLSLELNPNQPEVHYLKGLTYKDSGENELALSSFKEAFRILIKKYSLSMLQHEKE